MSAPTPAPSSPPAASATLAPPPASSAPPASSSSEPAPASTNAAATKTTPAEQPSPMRRATDKILGRTPANDVEKQQALLDEEAEKKRKRKRAAAGILGSLCTLLALALILTLVSIVWFVISSYSFPMLTCRMHGYNSHCMFNAWDKSHGTSVDHWFKEHLHLSGDW